MILYANMNVKTGEFLPARVKGTGHTSLAAEDPNVYAPRMFSEEKDAKRALTWWLKGISSDGNFGGIHTERVRDRNKEDWVTVALDCRLTSTKTVDIEVVDATIRRNFQERRT